MIRNKARIVARVNHALEKCGLSPTAKEWPVQYENLGRRYVGLALCDKISGSPIVKIDEAYYNPQKPKGAEDIYAHELIHHALPEAMSTAKLDWDGSHGKTFKRVAYAAGLRTWGDKTWRWKWTCPNCGAWVKSHKRGKVRACMRCPAVVEQKRITVNGASQIRTIATRPLMKCKKLF